MVQYFETLCAILAIQLQNCVPSRRHPTAPEVPVRDHSDSIEDTALSRDADADEAVTAREAVNWYIGVEGMDYGRLGPRDVYITAPQLADIVGYSEATARRRLDYFEEQGVVETNSSGDSIHWELTDEFSALADDNIRDEDVVTEATKHLLELAEDG